MRVNQRATGDRGSVLIIVGAFTIVAIIFLAFVIDIGDQRQNRRQLTTATDSAALALGQEWVETGFESDFDCRNSAFVDDLVVANNPVGNTTPDWACQLAAYLPYRSGTMVVDSRELVDYEFEGVTGLSSSDTNSLTSVRVQQRPGGGLRPIAVCEVNLPLDSWIESEEDPDVLVPPAAPLPIELSNDFGGHPNSGGDDACTAPGNWGQVEFGTGGGNPADANDFNEQIENGSPVDVAVNEVIDSFTGTGGFNSSAIEDLEGQTFWIPIYDRLTPGSGGNADYFVSGFLEVTLQTYTQSAATHTFIFLPQRFVTDGPCCRLNIGNADITICDVGTIGGQQSADASSRCAARTLPTSPPPPPPLPDPCEVLSVTPPTQQVGIVGPGAGGTLATPVLYDMTVVDGDDCLDAGLLAVRSAPPFGDIPGTVERVDPGGNLFQLRFDAGTFRKNSVYAVRVVQGTAVRHGLAQMVTCDGACVVP